MKDSAARISAASFVLIIKWRLFVCLSGNQQKSFSPESCRLLGPKYSRMDLAILTSLITRKRSPKKILGKFGPSVEPYGTPREFRPINSKIEDIFMKNIFPLEYFFLQGANMFNVLMQIFRKFSSSIQFGLMFSVYNFSKRICRNLSLQKFL